jgi:hypothetical protein
MSTETEAEQLRNLLQGSDATSVKKIPENYKATTATKLKTVLQGFSFGSSDEIEAFVRSLGKQDYDTVLQSIRSDLSMFREANPLQALALETGGAATSALLTMPFTGGASVPATAARMAMVGAAEGGSYAFNTGEGGFQERISRVPGAAVTGAVVNPVAATALRKGGDGLKALVRSARNLVGRRGSTIVNNEIQRLVNKLQKTPEEIVQDIMDGRILVENKTLAAAVKALRAKDGEAGELINTTLTNRPALTRKRAADEIDTALGGDGQLQVAKNQANRQAVREAENTAYAPFKTGEVNDEVFGELVMALEAVPAARKSLMEKFQTRVNDPNYTPLFKIKDGELQFLRRPNPEEAEVVRRSLDAAASKKFAKPGGGFVGEDIVEVATNVRSAIDANIPDLAAARTQAKLARDNFDAFDAGRNAFIGKPDIKIKELQDLFEVGNEEAINAYRSGMLSSIQARLKTGNRASFIKNLGDDEQGMNELLRMALPDETIESVMKKLDIATESNAAKSAILDRTNTAETLIENSNFGTRLGANTLMQLQMNDPRALGDIARSIVKMFGRDLTDAENLRIAKILVSEDPELVKSAVTDTGALKRLESMVNGIINLSTSAARPAVVLPASRMAADETGRNVSGILDMMGPR